MEFSEVYLKASIADCKGPITETRDKNSESDSIGDLTCSESYKNKFIDYTFKKNQLQMDNLLSRQSNLPIESEA